MEWRKHTWFLTTDEHGLTRMEYTAANRGNGLFDANYANDRELSPPQKTTENTKRMGKLVHSFQLSQFQLSTLPFHGFQSCTCSWYSSSGISRRRGELHLAGFAK